MDFVAIPTAMFESAGYVSATAGERDLLVRLYVLHSDCDSFTLDSAQSKLYGYEWPTTLLARVRSLLKAGLLVEIGRLKTVRIGPKPRIFSFAYRAADIYERVAA